MSIVIIHLETEKSRTDKFYYKLGMLIDELTNKGYTFKKLME